MTGPEVTTDPLEEDDEEDLVPVTDPTADDITTDAPDKPGDDDYIGEDNDEGVDTDPIDDDVDVDDDVDEPQEVLPGMKIFGREPTLWIAVIGQAILLLGTFGLRWLDNDQAALIVVAINALAAAATAFMVRPISPAAFTYALGSVVSVAAAYGLSITADQMAVLNTFVIGILALITRNQVSPVPTALTKGSLDPTPEAERVVG